AANTPLAATPEGFGAGTTGGGQTRDIVTVHTPAQLAHELCRTVGPSGLCSDHSPRIIKLAETIDFTGIEDPEDASVCNLGKVCAAPFKNEAPILGNADDRRCDDLAMKRLAMDGAGKNPLMVGSNKTVLGVGPHAGLKGKGLHLNSVSNVIVRNLTISDIKQGLMFGGDAITIANSHHLWISHNRFRNIGRQMLVAHFGPTTDITVSWNIFDGRNIHAPNCHQHHFNLRMAGSPQTITIANNWFKNVAAPAPHVESPAALVQLVNNYFFNDEWTGAAAHAPQAGTAKSRNGGVNVLVEGNYFHNLARPIAGSGANVFGSLGRPDTAMQTECKRTLRRDCHGNIAKPAPKENHFVEDSAVMKAFLAVPQARIVVPYSASDVPINVPAHAGPGKI
ncbi:MAG TPA: hypothetical protein VN089_19975, partial [Duganella sp.]|nr:hypothetical protein [Duganella sp.]